MNTNTSSLINYIILGIVVYILYKYFNTYNNNNTNNQQIDINLELTKRINELTKIINENKKTDVRVISSPPMKDIVGERDERVIADPLFPPYARMVRPIMDNVVYNSGTYFNNATRGSPDTYRQIGIAKDKVTNETYFLMGRQKYSGSSQGEFYLMPTDRQNQLKVQLLNSSGNQLIKDIYDIPTEITIPTGIFQNKQFQIEELQKSDFSSFYQ